MGRSIIFNGLELTVPDAYSYLDVSRLLSPSSSGIGIIALVGEANGGVPGLNLLPGGSTTDQIKELLHSGPLADMARLALRSGSDPDAPNGASQVWAIKTNQSLQSSHTFTNMKVTSKTYGLFTTAYTVECAKVGGAFYFTSRDENGVAEEAPAVGANEYFKVRHEGATTTAVAKLALVTGVLKFVTTIDSVADKSLTVGEMTLTQLKQALELDANYVVEIPTGKEQFLAKNLDWDTADHNIMPDSGDFRPGWKAGFYELVQWTVANSGNVIVERLATGAVIDEFAATALTGGERSQSTNSNVQAAINLALQKRVNIIVPLFSSDDQDGSTVDIASVNSMIKDHVQTRSSTLGRSECQAYVSIAGNKAAYLAECARMNSRYVAVTSQKLTDTDINGNTVTFPEYAFAVDCARIQAGSPIGTPLTGRVTSPVTQDASWNPVLDAVEMIKGGALFSAPDENNVFRIVAGYASWMGDTNNANIYIETVESLAVFNFNHRQYMRERFRGKSRYTPDGVHNAILDSCRFEKESVNSIKDYNPKTIKFISLTGGKIQYELEVVPWEGVNFVLPVTIATREV